MAVLYDTSNSAKHAAKTFDVTVANNPNRLAVGWFCYTRDTVEAEAMTFDGGAMTYIDESYFTYDGDKVGHVRMWFKLAPGVGVKAVAHTHANVDAFAHGCMILHQVNQTTPYTDVTKRRSDASVTSSNLSVPSASGHLVVDGCWTGGPEPTQAAGQTRRWLQATTGWKSSDFASSTELYNAGGTCEMGWTFTSEQFAQIGMSINPHPMGGTRGYIIGCQIRDFVKDLKGGLIPRDLIRKKYEEVWLFP